MFSLRGILLKKPSNRLAATRARYIKTLPHMLHVYKIEILYCTWLLPFKMTRGEYLRNKHGWKYPKGKNSHLQALQDLVGERSPEEIKRNDDISSASFYSLLAPKQARQVKIVCLSLLFGGTYRYCSWMLYCTIHLAARMIWRKVLEEHQFWEGGGLVWTRWSSIFLKHPFCQASVLQIILFFKSAWC